MAGKLQNEDFKTEAELTVSGGTASQLLNDSKIWITGGGINKTLNDAIVAGDIGGGDVNSVNGQTGVVVIDAGDIGFSGAASQIVATNTQAAVDEVVDRLFRNYIKNGSANVDTAGWATYADAAGASPVDGTGGTANITWTRSTSSPLRDEASFLFTKDAANRQGEGVSYAFTIASADKTSPCTIKFAYEVASGTYDNGDLSIWVVDVTSGQAIQPSPPSVLGAVGPAKNQPAEFQLNTNTSYRLCIHASSTSAAAYSVKFDDISVSPNVYANGSVVGQPVSYTPVFTGFGTVTNIQMEHNQIGDQVRVKGQFQVGTPTGTTASFTLPVSFSARVPGSASAIAGRATRNVATATTNDLSLIVSNGANLVQFGTIGNATTSPTSPLNGNDITGASSTFYVDLMIGVQGWGTSQVLSSETSSRLVSFQAVKSAGSVTANTTIPSWTLVNEDTHGAFNATTGVYTVPVPGDYMVGGIVNTTSGSPFLSIYKNGTAVMTSPVASAPLRYKVPNCKAGDTLTIAISASLTVSTSTAPYFTAFEAERLAGPAQIAASEKVYAQYTNNAGTGTTANVTDIPFITRVQDSHGAFASGVFTAPRAGWYDFNGSIKYAANAVREHYLYVNGSQRLRMDPVSASISVYAVSAGVYLNAGETASIRNNNSSTLQASAIEHWISVRSQG